jgi:hypothetical protein
MGTYIGHCESCDITLEAESILLHFMRKNDAMDNSDNFNKVDEDLERINAEFASIKDIENPETEINKLDEFTAERFTTLLERYNSNKVEEILKFTITDFGYAKDYRNGKEDVPPLTDFEKELLTPRKSPRRDKQ